MSKKNKESKFPKRIYTTIDIDGKDVYVDAATTPEWLLSEDGDTEHVGTYELVETKKMRKTMTTEVL